MDFIKLNSVLAKGGILRIGYEISPALEPYFTTARVFEVEYSEDISTVPESVLVIPFVCNVLPVAWLADAVLELPQLDREFYEGLPEILRGYKEMTPMLEYKGAVQVGQLVDNSFESTEQVAAFFSGGVDAFATLIAHAEEKPQLITIWGADVKLDDAAGWELVKQHAEATSEEFGLPAPLLVRSNFRMLLNEGTLGELVVASGDGWWHGFQHGIALIAHAAPSAYMRRIRTVYIASSYTPEIKAVCASDPTIDNHVHLSSARVWHDQYECSRQQKVQNIVAFCREAARRVNLRVCWITAGGTNCGVCEKCIRTIVALLAEGAAPAAYGFPGWEQLCPHYNGVVRRTLQCGTHLRAIWQDIQDRFQETQAYRKDKRINWIYTLDVNRPLTWKMRVKQAVKQRFPFIARVLRFSKRKLQGK